MVSTVLYSRVPVPYNTVQSRTVPKTKMRQQQDAYR